MEGSVVEVSEGYARNFLFPQNLAVQASPQALSAVKEKKERAVKQTEKALAASRKLAQKLDGYEITVKAKMTDKGSLFGAVGVKDVVKAFKAEGIAVEPEWVVISKPIKETGTHRLTLDLPHGLEAEISLTVEGEL